SQAGPTPAWIGNVVRRALESTAAVRRCQTPSRLGRALFVRRRRANLGTLGLKGGLAMVIQRMLMAACAGGAMVLASLTASPAVAQVDYPIRPITIVVPFTAGGATDLLARMVAERLKSGLGATVVVENKPGAASTVGANYVAKAPPDGYTLLMATSTTLA